MVKKHKKSLDEADVDPPVVDFLAAECEENEKANNLMAANAEKNEESEQFASEIAFLDLGCPKW